MKFEAGLVSGTLKKRYKRFLADVLLSESVGPGKTNEVVAHCPNTGAMTGCAESGARVWLSPSNNPKRKLAFTWELVEVSENQYACINTSLANKLVEEGIRSGCIKELQGYANIRQEVKYGLENSRIDLLLSDHSTDSRMCYVEIKSVTLLECSLAPGRGAFPDAVSQRGQKHLRELAEMASQGHRAMLLFLVNHTGIDSVQAASHIDEEYARMLEEAISQGVEVYAYKVCIEPESNMIELNMAVPFIRTA